MRATSIVRRIDDLGRILIPKEIRRTLRLHEGDPMEFFIDRNAVVLRPYHTMSFLEEHLKNLIDALKSEKSSGVDFFLTDNRSVLGSTAPGTLTGMPISEALRDVIENRRIIENCSIKLIESPENGYQVRYVYPILHDGEIIGSICAWYSDTKAFEERKSLIKFTAALLVGYMRD